MQMLNIDTLLGETKTLVWRNVKYVIAEPTVEDALRMQCIVDKLTDKTAAPEIVVQDMLEMIKKAIPDLDASTLPLRVIPAVFVYIAAVKLENEQNLVADLENAISMQPATEKKKPSTGNGNI